MTIILQGRTKIQIKSRGSLLRRIVIESFLYRCRSPEIARVSDSMRSQLYVTSDELRTSRSNVVSFRLRNRFFSFFCSTREDSNIILPSHGLNWKSIRCYIRLKVSPCPKWNELYTREAPMRFVVYSNFIFCSFPKFFHRRVLLCYFPYFIFKLTGWNSSQMQMRKNCASQLPF